MNFRNYWYKVESISFLRSTSTSTYCKKSPFVGRIRMQQDASLNDVNGQGMKNGFISSWVSSSNGTWQIGHVSGKSKQNIFLDGSQCWKQRISGSLDLPIILLKRGTWYRAELEMMLRGMFVSDLFQRMKLELLKEARIKSKAVRLICKELLHFQRLGLQPGSFVGCTTPAPAKTWCY